MIMVKEEKFFAWGPGQSLLLSWGKPVLFSHLRSSPSYIPVQDLAIYVGWSHPLSEKTVLVIDLPGSEGVLMGVALAARGYRPVPLYNAVPLPFGSLLDPLTGPKVAAVDVMPILSALRKGSEQLAQLHLPFDAPPAFLLDA